MSSDQPLPSSDEAALRRLLAEARHDEPVPADVAARIDRALGDAAAHDAAVVRAGPVGLAPVASSRRRRVRVLLAAAAAVAVAGVGAEQVLRQGGSEPAASSVSGAASGAQDSSEQVRRDRGPAHGTSGAQSVQGDATGPADPGGATGYAQGGRAGSAASGAPGPGPGPGPGGSVTVRPRASRSSIPPLGTLELLGGPPRVRASSFPRDVREVRRRALGVARSAGGRALDAAAFACEPAAWGPGRTIAVRYSGTPAVLVLRPPTGESQVVDLLRCGTAEVVRSITLPRR